MSIEVRLSRLEKNAPQEETRPCGEWYPAAVESLLTTLSDGEWHSPQQDLYPRLQSLLSWQEMTKILLPWTTAAGWIMRRQGTNRQSEICLTTKGRLARLI